jgi:hypothetical protein
MNKLSKSNMLIQKFRTIVATTLSRGLRQDDQLAKTAETDVVTIVWCVLFLIFFFFFFFFFFLFL